MFVKPCTIELLVAFLTEQVQVMMANLKTKHYVENELAWLTHIFVSSQYLHNFLPLYYSLNGLVEAEEESTLTTSCLRKVLELVKNLRGDERRFKYEHTLDCSIAAYAVCAKPRKLQFAARAVQCAAAQPCTCRFVDKCRLGAFCSAPKPHGICDAYKRVNFTNSCGTSYATPASCPPANTSPKR